MYEFIYLDRGIYSKRIKGQEAMSKLVHGSSERTLVTKCLWVHSSSCIFFFLREMMIRIIVASWGCHNKVLEPGWLQAQKLVISWFWSLEVQT